MRMKVLCFVLAVVAIALASTHGAFAAEAAKPKIQLVEPEGGAQAQAEAHAMVQVDEAPPACCAPAACAPVECCAPVSCCKPRFRCHKFRVRRSRCCCN